MADLGAIGTGSLTPSSPGAAPAGGLRGIIAAVVSLPISTWLGITTLPPGAPWTASAPSAENFVSPGASSAFVVPLISRVLGR